MTVVEETLFGDDDWVEETFQEKLERIAAERRAYRKAHKADPRVKLKTVPVRNGIRFCIVPEVAPILRELAARCEKDVDPSFTGQKVTGISVLAARAAVTMKATEAGVVRRLYAVMNQRQLFINANFIEGVLISMDAEHEFTYGEWPSCRADALQIVSDFAKKGTSPSKLLRRANLLYEKGVRKALKRAPEVRY